MRAWLLAALTLAGFTSALCPPLLAAEGEDALLADGSRFAQAALEGDDETVVAMASERLQGAMVGAAGERLRSGLSRQFGALQGLDDPWLEHEEDAYRRVRVPARFERGVIDLRVVIDQEGSVVGFFMAPHEDRSATGDGAGTAAQDADDTPPPEGVTDIPLTVGSAEAGLAARLSVPAGDGPFPAAVLVHGSGALDMDGTVGPNKVLRELAWGLASRGVAVLRYDKRSHARPADLMKLGPTLTADHVITDDARDAVALLRAQNQVDDGRVFVIGHSLGGTLAPRIASGIEPAPAGVVALAGLVRPVPETMLAQSRYVAEIDGEVSQQEAEAIAQLEEGVSTLRAMLDNPGAAVPTVPILGVSYSFWKDLDRYDPPAVAADLDTPVLIVQGGRDYQVTFEDFDLWRAGLADTEHACFARFDDLDHLLRPGSGPSKPADYETAIPIAPALLDAVAAWLRDRTCPGGEAAEGRT